MTILEFLMDVKRIPYWDRTPAVSDDDLEDLINQADMTKKNEQYSPYPILGSRPQQYPPWIAYDPRGTGLGESWTISYSISRKGWIKLGRSTCNYRR